MGVDYVGLLTGGEYHPGARVRRADGVRGIARDGQPEHVHRQLERRRRRRHGQHLRRHDLLEEHAGRGHFARARATSSTSSTRAGVRGSFIHGDVNDLRGTINRDVNTFDPPDPRFDAQFVPQAPEYAAVGYRPVKRVAPARRSSR